MMFHTNDRNRLPGRAAPPRAALSLGVLLAGCLFAVSAGAVPPEKPADSAHNEEPGNYYTADELSEIYGLYIDAYLAHEAGDATRELEVLRTLERKRPRSGHVRSKMAEYLLKEGETEKGLEEAQKAVEMAPDSFEPRRTLGQALFQAGDLESASAEFEKALELRPQDYASLLFLSEIYETAGDYLAAATANMRLAYLRPNNAWQHQYRAAVNLIHAGQYQQAIDMLERVVGANPANHDALNRLARLYRALGRNEDAVRLYQEIIDRFRFRDAVADAHIQLADLYYEMGKVDDAEAELLWVLKNRPGILDARRKLGIIRFSRGDYDTAIELLSAWVERHPDRLGDVYFLARSYQSRAEERRRDGDTDGAAKDAEEAARWYGAILDSNAGHLRSLAGLQAVLPPEKIGEVMDRYDAAIASVEKEATGEEAATDNLLRRALLTMAKAEAAEGSEIPEIAAVAEKAREESIRLYEKVLETDPENAAALEALGGVYQEEQDWDKARDYYTRLEKIEPEDNVVHYRLGFTEFQLRNYAAAAEHFRSGADLAKSDVFRSAHLYYLGVCEYLLGNYEAAEEALRSGMELTEKKDDFISQLALVLARLKKYDEAENLLTTALEGQPNDPGFSVRLAVVYQEQKDYARAAKVLEKALDEHPDDVDLVTRLSAVYDEQGEGKKAESILQSAIARHPEEKDLYLQLAMVFERRKDLEGVEKTIGRLLEIDANNADALNFLGYTYADYNVKLDKAYDLIKKALALEPENPMYIDSLGWVYYRQGKYREAVEELRRAVEKLGTDPVVLDHLGDALQATGETDEALTYWKKAAEIDPEKTEIREKIDRARQVKE